MAASMLDQMSMSYQLQDRASILHMVQVKPLQTWQVLGIHCDGLGSGWLTSTSVSRSLLLVVLAADGLGTGASKMSTCQAVRFTHVRHSS